MSRVQVCILLAASTSTLAVASPARAETSRSRFVPAGSAYADSVIQYAPGHSGGCLPTHPNFIDPKSALGAPNYSGGAYGTGTVSLGGGGLLELFFGGQQFTNSGDANPDLRFVEVGGFDEAYFVAVRPAPPTTAQQLSALGLTDNNQDGFFEIGRASGGNSTLDLDRHLNVAVAARSLVFDAVQLMDDDADHPTCTTTVGADIDAVEALDGTVDVAPRSWGSVKLLYRQ